MRELNVWAYNTDFGTLCRWGQLDQATGLAYPKGNQQGQAGWDVTIPFDSLKDLAARLSKGVPMPKQYCGNYLYDCAEIARGEIVRLAIMAHGNQGGVWLPNGKSREALKPDTVAGYHADLHTIGLYTQESATILLTGCLSAQGEPGARLLGVLSGIWPGRKVVGFTTVGYRHPGMMKRRGEACELPGMRDTDATDELYADRQLFDSLWSDLEKMPWSGEQSTHAVVVKDGTVMRCPKGELCGPTVRKSASKAVASPPVHPKKRALTGHH